MLQRVAPISLPRLAGHAAQLEPPSAENVPAAHATHAAATALVLPSGAPEPAVHGVPSQAARVPAAAACVPLGQGVQPALQRHWLLLLHEVVEVLRVLKKREPSLLVKQLGGSPLHVPSPAVLSACSSATAAASQSALLVMARAQVPDVFHA